MGENGEMRHLSSETSWMASASSRPVSRIEAAVSGTSCSSVRASSCSSLAVRRHSCTGAASLNPKP